MNQKIVYDFTKFTTTDYTGYLSCVIWFKGCNMRCQYCYNDDIVFSKNGNYTLNDILTFLKNRVGMLDAVVLSGGEATLYDLSDFCKKIKELGFKIKLDTNGTNFTLIEKLTKEKLIDYMAIDFKAPKYKYKTITGINAYTKFINIIKYLITINFTFELRTTVNSSLLDENDLNNMINILTNLGYQNTYYLQNFLQTSSNIGNIQKQRDINKEELIQNSLTIQWRN
ncbi:anaerobic ribonucleoside-triphosphate reductase activating protein [Arcobacter sp. F2176]|uniref:anaerobic ribonucleoside-triphosphate reductase activating protein n=1 Tax=unclassified Arcobacter TaxID=2593671 RepID=UPI00100BF9EC|nr:anaerobic ribonucleoside-triphosphate reductase activating protein [Arcobacter sp. F2176]RXJ82617.1 anaerobic ribonucleoside-triphosphate reductase activating protein [Arcobacter sp. F2176]